MPRKADVGIAKNYLAAEELEALNRIVTVYLEFAELQAMNRKPMYMADWIGKLDDFRVPRRHAQHPKGGRSRPNCMEDEGRPLGIGVQAQVPNHFELLGSRVRVVSVEGKGAARPRQVRSKKTNASEPLMTCREELLDVETGQGDRPGMSPE